VINGDAEETILLLLLWLENNAGMIRVETWGVWRKRRNNNNKIIIIINSCLIITSILLFHSLF
jgi:hypothetical protein